MLTQQDYITKDKENYLPVFNRYNMVLDHGEGPYIYDVNGKRYLDFLAGIAVNIVGHNYPPLVEAISTQASKLIHCSNLYYTPQQVEAAEKLKQLTGMDRVFFGNSGAEANEGALKLARKYAHNIDPEKIEIISANHSFHGRTFATLTATGQAKYQQGLGPLPAGFIHVPYNDIIALEAVISHKTCAVMLEAIQGEGGVNIPDSDYLPKVRQLCDKYGALLIMDEIQCGVGRTGKFMGCENFGIKPDIVTFAKGLAGGVPIGAFCTSNKIAEAFHFGDHGTTFGGNPLACAAASVILSTLVEENLMDNAIEVGNYFKQQLSQLQTKYPKLITAVRGYGLLIGMELTTPGANIVTDCMAAGLIINCTASTVLRFAPPLNITKQHVDELIGILDTVLAKHS